MREGGAPDGALPGGGSPDGGSPDGGSPDGGSPDGAAPDGAAPDGGSPDGGSPDGAAPDGAAPVPGAVKARRRSLPHFDAPGAIQFVTFRLHDSIDPRRFASDRAHADESDDDDLMDAGSGTCLLRVPDHAEMVANALRHFDGSRYRLHAWCVMPNHVHVLMTCIEPHRLADVVKAWKRVTARELNRSTGRTGAVWAHDYFDRFMRDTDHFNATMRYLEHNPVKAGLVSDPSEWRWSSAHRSDKR
jgi:REP element-mobilizing transposase RayT